MRGSLICLSWVLFVACMLWVGQLFQPEMKWYTFTWEVDGREEYLTIQGYGAKTQNSYTDDADPLRLGEAFILDPQAQGHDPDPSGKTWVRVLVVTTDVKLSLVRESLTDTQ